MPPSTILPHDTGNVPFPNLWRERLAGCVIEAQAIGASRADVYRVQGGGGRDVFIKREPADDPFGELHDEVVCQRALVADARGAGP